MSHDDLPASALQRQQNMDGSGDNAALTEDQHRQLRDEYHQCLDVNNISADQYSYEDYRAARMAEANHHENDPDTEAR